MKRLSAALAVLIFAVLLCSALAVPAAAADTSGFAAEVVRLVNVERAKAGLDAALIRVCGMSPLFLCI